MTYNKNEAENGQKISNGIVDIIRETIEEHLTTNHPDEYDMLDVEQDKKLFSGIDYLTDPMTYIYFSERINQISHFTVNEVFAGLSATDTIENMTPVLLKGSGNGLWSFMFFMLSCIQKMDIMNPDIDLVSYTLKEYCVKILEKEEAKLTNFFKDHFLIVFCNAVKRAENYQKRLIVVNLLYYFFPENSVAKHEALRTYKEGLDDMDIFIQSLPILIVNEKE